MRGRTSIVVAHRLSTVAALDRIVVLEEGRIVEASTGEYAKRYGFIYVDYYDDGTGDGHRVRKDSFYDYQRIIAEVRSE